MVTSATPCRANSDANTIRTVCNWASVFFAIRACYHAGVAEPATIQALLRQTARWTVAAEQDANPMIALMHANYGVATLDALRQVASDADVIAVTGYDPRQIHDHVTSVQDWAARRFAQYVPELVPDSPMAVIAGEA